MTNQRFAIIGGGLVGLATARALLRSTPGASVTLLEKERACGMHQSSHNSGVLHAGLYYRPGSFKALLAVDGIRQMSAFCSEQRVPHEVCGKLVVAVDESEVARLRTLFDRGTANGLRGLRWLSAEQAREIEPHVRCVAAVHVPEEGIVDYPAVCRALVREVERLGGTITTSAAVERIDRTAKTWTVSTNTHERPFDFLINCAGLHSDRVARMAGARSPCRIVPFRGQYYKLGGPSASLVRHLVYPVPNPTFPFLGVHFTRLIHGGIEAGPNAALALAREAYTWRDLNARDAVDAIGFAGTWRFLRRHARQAALELVQSLSTTRFARALQRLIPEVHARDLQFGGTGVRAQAMLPSGELVDDFLMLEDAAAIHVLNAPSPAATASLAIAAHIVNRMKALAA